MRILLATYILDEHTGAELYVRDLARGLHAAGHTVSVYAINAGALAGTMASEGIEVVDDLSRIATAPDLIHAQHQPALIDALLRFPATPAVYVIHDATSSFDAPFAFRRVRRHVAVDQRCLARVAADARVSAEQRRVILNFVDLERFRPRPPPPARPKRALVFSNYAKAPAELAAIESACQAAGISLWTIGKASGRPTDAPEALLGQYDIVFAKARAAIEAMAVGCAVVLCDFAGLGEMVTAERFDELRTWNFGAGVLTQPITAEGVARALARYDPDDAAKVTDRMRREAGLDQAVEQWLALYGEVLAEPVQPDTAVERASLRAALRPWRGVRRVDRLRQRTRGLKQDRSPAGALYRFGRSLWRILDSPGAVRR